MEAEAPLIEAEAPSEAAFGSSTSATYAPPSVAVKAPPMPSRTSLPSDPQSREMALQQWADDLQKWQRTLEEQSQRGAHGGQSARENNWPWRRGFWRQDIAGDIPPEARRTVRLAYGNVWLLWVALTFNAVAMTVLKTSFTTDLSELVWSFVLYVLFGCIAVFSVYRLLYTGLRKMRQSLVAETVFFLGLQLLVLLTFLVGIPGSGTAGIWVTLDTAKLSPPPIAGLVCCGIASSLFFVALILTVVTWFRVRRIYADLVMASRPSTLNDDAYMRFEERNSGAGVAVFSLGSDDEEEPLPVPKAPKEPPRQPRRMSPPKSVPPPLPEAEEDDIASHTTPVVIGSGELDSEDEDMFTGGSSTTKKTKKKKKKKKSAR